MDGFKIDYISSNGEKNTTWFGRPISSMDISKLQEKHIVQMVDMFFSNAYPGCDIVSIESCKQDDYLAMTND